MTPHTPPPVHRAAPTRGESSLGTLIALLLATLVPIALGAYALGWRPPSLPLVPQVLALFGRASPTDVAPSDAAGWAIPGGWFFARGPGAESGMATGFAVTDAESLGFWRVHQE